MHSQRVNHGYTIKQLARRKDSANKSFILQRFYYIDKFSLMRHSSESLGGHITCPKTLLLALGRKTHRHARTQAPTQSAEVDQ